MGSKELENKKSDTEVINHDKNKNKSDKEGNDFGSKTLYQTKQTQKKRLYL